MSRPEPTTPSEVERLVRAYERYDTNPANEARWGLTNPGNRAIHAERASRVARLLDGRLARGPVVDVGCGSGQVLAELPSAMPSVPLVGVDLSAARLAAAVPRVPGATFVQAEGSALPFPPASIGTALTFTLFSSVLDDDLARALAGEIDRVIEPGGIVVWYDLRRRNPANPQVRPIGRAAVQALFPGWTADLASVTVLPPLARRLGPATGRLYPVLARVRPLTTHLVGVLAKPS